MKKILLATAAMFTFAGAASALDFGNGLALDNELHAAYEVNAKATTLEYTANLNYVFAEGAVVYVETVVDLQDINYNGLELGVTYSPASATGVEFGAHATYDADWNNDEIVVEATFSF